MRSILEKNKKIIISLIVLLVVIIGIIKLFVVKKDTSDSWHNDTIFYHLWVKSFADSNDSDQIGDIKGIIEKLDYLNDGNPETDTDLGITGIWLSPIFECSLKSDDPQTNMHGYDTIDYYKINTLFGNEKDIEKLLEEAHKRGIKVVFDFVLNHTSTKHPWFLKSKEDEGKRDWYVWNENPGTSWQSAWEGGVWTDVWKPLNLSFFYTAFQTADLADLNFHNSAVKSEMINVANYWLDKGFDGLRADAVRYLYEDGPKKQADRPATHRFFKELRTMLDKDDKVLIGEAYEHSGTVKQYYGNGKDEFHICIDFDFATTTTKVVNGIEPDSLEVLYGQQDFPKGSRNGTFLSNHDNVTSRPYTLYWGDTKKCALAAAFNIFSPGVPFVYYGNEIGMEGKSGHDINLRKLFNWDTVKLQTNNKDSLLSWYRYLIKARNNYIALRRGKYKNLTASEFEVQVSLRTYDDENILVILNTSKDERDITLDLSETELESLPVWSILGDYTGDKTIKAKSDEFKIGKIPGFGILVLYIGEEKQNKIYGYSKEIIGGSKEVELLGKSYSSMFIRGTMNDWKGNLAMNKVGKHLWKRVVELKKGEYFYKFEVGGNAAWRTNWGDRNLDGEGDTDAANIRFFAPVKSKYEFSFNEDTLVFNVKAVK